MLVILPLSASVLAEAVFRIYRFMLLGDSTLFNCVPCRLDARNAFRLQVQQQATIDVELSVDSIATSVSVEALAPLLNTTSATLGQVVENKYILSLPLAGRAPLALVALSPGLTPSNLSPGGQSNTNFVANGTRNSTADVLLDGMSVANVEQNSGITNLEYH